ncbi:hypothetical protein HPP92_020574 [Vanilla planifolia]|uniref:Uncharacterized protein n=1 Tax=Vanilla planifolia TaxID=51239 RepID=A0A835Q5C5_VANPL|nr:hypothetical protein HPP92_020574 [Vanilla planifolia]
MAVAGVVDSRVVESGADGDAIVWKKCDLNLENFLLGKQGKERVEMGCSTWVVVGELVEVIGTSGCDNGNGISVKAVDGRRFGIGRYE